MNYPYTINPGGPNHEELVSLIGIYEYFENLYNHHYKKKISTLEKIEKINNINIIHEEEIANPILNYISSRDDLILIGKNFKIVNKNRAPTISFISKIKIFKRNY